MKQPSILHIYPIKVQAKQNLYNLFYGLALSATNHIECNTSSKNNTKIKQITLYLERSVLIL